MISTTVALGWFVVSSNFGYFYWRLIHHLFVGRSRHATVNRVGHVLNDWRKVLWIVHAWILSCNLMCLIDIPLMTCDVLSKHLTETQQISFLLTIWMRPCNLWKLDTCFFIDVSANSFWTFSRISLTFVTFGAFWASFEISKMVALTLTTLLLSLAPVANGYVRMATAVGGDVVLGAGNLTQGGKVGLYTVLLQAGVVMLWASSPPKKTPLETVV